MTGVGSKKNLGYRVLQAMPLPGIDDEALRPLLLLDSSEKVHVEPETALPLAVSLAHSIYVYVANPVTGVVNGYTMAQSTPEVCTLSS